MFRKLEKTFDLQNFFNFSLIFNPSYLNSNNYENQNEAANPDNKYFSHEFYCEEGRIFETCRQPLYYPGMEGYQVRIRFHQEQYKHFKNMTVAHYATSYLYISKEEYLNNQEIYKEYYQHFLNVLKNKINQHNEDDFINQQINNMIRLIERPCLLHVLYLLKIGYKTTASNAYNVGHKGVWFESKNINFFFSLTGEVWENIPLPTYENINSNPYQKPTMLTPAEVAALGIDPSIFVNNAPEHHSTLGKLTVSEVKEAILYIESQIQLDPAIGLTLKNF
ncbi:hypothetical protein LEAN103870_08305 [Legionella anisa]|uniref:Uncharacterized protein n=1 Tax=Legionella anisa TaxID=28082 RepID=A0AAX0WPH9_9GAMM|nr:hypothetical protein [Legionella anisa]AWN73174.1 hypothetical protein DLD14_04580 [Legionella anisa]KTC69446.1 hypothetical protein Lani_2635 [Legionella anisa]MBN5934749.1 hypothetical protein [Legionella anisa]MCW8424006.1 hypothetical protein [Legionella anisa]MCW8447528.1 hypothetical protein [Legionella anisa]